MLSPTSKNFVVGFVFLLEIEISALPTYSHLGGREEISPTFKMKSVFEQAICLENVIQRFISPALASSLDAPLTKRTTLSRGVYEVLNYRITVEFLENNRNTVSSRGKGYVSGHGTLLLGTLLPEGHVWASIEGERVL